MHWCQFQRDPPYYVMLPGVWSKSSQRGSVFLWCQNPFFRITGVKASGAPKWKVWMIMKNIYWTSPFISLTSEAPFLYSTTKFIYMCQCQLDSPQMMPKPSLIHTSGDSLRIPLHILSTLHNTTDNPVRSNNGNRVPIFHNTSISICTCPSP